MSWLAEAGHRQTSASGETKAISVQLGLDLTELGNIKKMPQSGVGSMQGKNTGNMPSAVCASSINKSLDPTPI